MGSQREHARTIGDSVPQHGMDKPAAAQLLNPLVVDTEVAPLEEYSASLLALAVIVI